MASYGYIGAPANFNGTDPDTGGDSGESFFLVLRLLRDFPSPSRALLNIPAKPKYLHVSNEPTTSLHFPEKNTEI